MRSMLFVTVASVLVGCSSKDEETNGITADEAITEAVAITGGTASEATAVTEDGQDMWEVDVAMSNGAEIEVVLYAEDGKLYEIYAGEGPFDYDTLDPLPGSLTYADARAIAFATVDGDMQAWEVKDTSDGYFYEFYIRELGDQLWEIKLWADDGEVFVVEAVNEQD